MQSNEYNFSDSHLIRHCRKKHLNDRWPSYEAFLIRRGVEDYLSFNCLEMLCCDAWDLVNERPKAISELEKSFPLSLKDTDLWAISHCNIIINSIRRAAHEAARNAKVEYTDVLPTISQEARPNNPSHVGVKWNSQAISVPENCLDLAIANKLSASVEYTFPAKKNRRR